MDRKDDWDRELHGGNFRRYARTGNIAARMDTKDMKGIVLK